MSRTHKWMGFDLELGWKLCVHRFYRVPLVLITYGGNTSQEVKENPPDYEENPPDYEENPPDYEERHDKHLEKNDRCIEGKSCKQLLVHVQSHLVGFFSAYISELINSIIQSSTFGSPPLPRTDYKIGQN